jgi:hypothetical protein
MPEFLHHHVVVCCFLSSSSSSSSSFGDCDLDVLTPGASRDKENCKSEAGSDEKQ